MAQTVASTRRKSAKKAKRSLSSGQIHIAATFNNTIVTVTDLDGNTVAWSSAGATGFKGSRKSTPFAARLAAEAAVKTAQGLGMQEVQLFVKRPRAWSRVGYPCCSGDGYEGCLYHRHYPCAAQWLPSPKRRRV